MARHDPLDAALREAEERFARAVRHAPFPAIVYADDGEMVLVNDQWTEQTGYALEDLPTFEDWLKKGQGDNDPWDPSGIDALYESDEPVDEGEYPVATRDGQQRRWEFRSLPVGCLADGRRAVLRTAIDLTEQSEVTRALWDVNIRLVDVLECITDGFLALDLQGRVIYLNQMAEQVLSRKREDLVGKPLWDVYPPDMQIGFRVHVETAIREERAVHAEVPYAPLDLWYECHVYPSAKGVSLYFRDVTRRKRGQERQRLLAEAGAILSGSLGVQETLQSISHVVVPVLADWCLVDLVEQDGTVRRWVVAHADPTKAHLAHDLQHKHPAAARPGYGIAKAIETGQAQLITDVPASLIETAPITPEHKRALLAMPLRSYICAPLVARGRTLGAISLIGSAPGRRYDEADLALACELALRAALAVDNARLYQEAQEARLAQERTAGLLETILSSLPVGFSFLDTELRYVRVNEVMAGINGLSAAQHLGRKVEEILPGVAAAALPRLRQVLSTGQPVVNVETRVMTRAFPESHWVSASTYPVRGADGEIIGVGNIVVDVNEQKLHAEQLERTNQTLQAILSASPAAIVLLDLEGAVTMWNPAAERMFGWTAEEVIGRPMPLVPPEHWEQYLAMRNVLFEGGTVSNVPVPCARKDGTALTVELSIAPVRDGAGTMFSLMGIMAEMGRVGMVAPEQRPPQPARKHTSD